MNKILLMSLLAFSLMSIEGCSLDIPGFPSNSQNSSSESGSHSSSGDKTSDSSLKNPNNNQTSSNEDEYSPLDVLYNTVNSKNYSAYLFMPDETGKQNPDTWGFTLKVDENNYVITIDENDDMYIRLNGSTWEVYENGRYYDIEDYNPNLFTLIPYPTVDAIFYTNYGIYDDEIGMMTDIVLKNAEKMKYDEKTDYYYLDSITAVHGELNTEYMQMADTITFSYGFKLSLDGTTVESIGFKVLSSDHEGMDEIAWKIDFFDINKTVIEMPVETLIEEVDPLAVLYSTINSTNYSAYCFCPDENGNQDPDTWGFALNVDKDNYVVTIDEINPMYMRLYESTWQVFDTDRYYDIEDYNSNLFTLIPYPTVDGIFYTNYGICDDEIGMMTDIVLKNEQNMLYDDSTGYYYFESLTGVHGELDTECMTMADTISFKYAFKLSEDESYVETITFEILSSECEDLAGIRWRMDFYDVDETVIEMPVETYDPSLEEDPLVLLYNTVNSSNYSACCFDPNQYEDFDPTTWGVNVKADGTNIDVARGEGESMYFRLNGSRWEIYESGEYYDLEDYNPNLFTMLPYPTVDGIFYTNYGIYQDGVGYMTDIVLANADKMQYDESTNRYYFETLTAVHGELDSYYMTMADTISFSYSFELSEDRTYVKAYEFEILSSDYDVMVGISWRVEFSNLNQTVVEMPL